MEEVKERNVETEQKALFEKLVQLDVSNRTEEKNGLTYLSWAWAWQEFKLKCPDATYSIKTFHDETGIEKPYLRDRYGIMVFTSITAKGITYEMWLPVMDGANKAMKDEPYTYEVKKNEWDAQKRKNVWNGEYEQKSVEAATMFDINKTIMRCLVKNIAMFGLGLYIYAGEDLPAELDFPITEKQIETIKSLGVNEPNVCKRYNISDISELTAKQADFVISTKKKTLEEKGE